MQKRKILNHLNIYAQCKSSGLPLWQCPQFLFLLMGSIIIITSIAFYVIGTQYVADPSIVALIVLIINVILFVIGFSVVKSFEKLAEASKLKSEFINIISHQVRSPLTNLKWVVDILHSKDIEKNIEKEEEYFSSLKENIRRISDLIDNLLVVSRIQEGTLVSNKKEIDVRKVISDMIFRFKVFAEASNIKIEFNSDEDTPNILIDPFQINLVIENLIDNAIRYTTQKGKIEISLKRKGKEILFKIKDSGVGIPENDQKYIFQKFFRAYSPLKEKTRGSGLGLFITKSIIEKEGGRIWFESKEMEGTSFLFTLPIN